MNILVTGGGGFLGLHLVKELVNQGHNVYSFSRAPHPELEKIQVRHISGNLKDKENVISALKGIEACFHVASKVAMWGRWNDFYTTNVLGTKNIIEGCKKHGVKYLIYTSSPSVVFGKESISGEDESLPYPANSYSLYAKSKAMAEQLVLAANHEQLKTISLRPHLIFGPGDQNLIPNLLAARDKNRLKIIGDGKNKVDVLYVSNAVDAHLCALEKIRLEGSNVSGKSYFIGQGPVPLWDFINDVLKHKGRDIVTQKISIKKAFMVGFLIEKVLIIFRVFNIQPPMTRFVALQLGKDHYFNHQKANQLLGWNPKVSIDEAILSL